MLKLISNLLLVALIAMLCFAIPYFGPEWLTQGIIIFLLFAILLVVTNQPQQNNGKTD